MSDPVFPKLYTRPTIANVFNTPGVAGRPNSLTLYRKSLICERNNIPCNTFGGRVNSDNNCFQATLCNGPIKTKTTRLEKNYTSTREYLRAKGKDYDSNANAANIGCADIVGANGRVCPNFGANDLTGSKNAKYSANLVYLKNNYNTISNSARLRSNIFPNKNTRYTGQTPLKPVNFITEAENRKVACQALSRVRGRGSKCN
tara:strand:+ start:313 stop:918 length:606 start_codon:yes stop_codon:yes gene_type:complete